MFKNCRKDDLRLIAKELGLEINDRMTVLEITDVIKNSERFKTNSEFISDLATSIVEERKAEDQKQLEFERLKLERAKTELEIARIRAEPKANNEEAFESNNSLDSLVKSVRTLTIKVPSKPENWGFFFSSLERAFVVKSVPEKYKSEILLNLLGEKSSNIITYIDDDDLNKYEKVKEIVLREFQPTAQSCLEDFRATTRQLNETYVQFASRLTTSWNYYLKLRNVSDFKTLNHLIVSDKLFQTLDRETSSYISVKQSDTWFDPIKLGKEIDLYMTSRGKPQTKNSISYNKNYNVKNISKAFLSDVKTTKCILCNDFHPLYMCSNYKRLTVNEKVQVVKDNNFCFNCLGKHKVNSCKSNYSCAKCKKRHHITLHFNRDQNSAVQYKFRDDNSTSSGLLKNQSENEKTSFSPLSPLASEFTPAAEAKCSGANVFSATSSCVSNVNKTVLLSTAICYLCDSFGNECEVRILLDSGSMSHFISKECTDRLQLRRNKINIVVSGLNDSAIAVRSQVSATLINKSRTFRTDLDLLVVPRITDLTPSKRVDKCVDGLDNINLADECFHIPQRVDLLIGAEAFFELLKPGQICPPNSNLILQNSVFGYLVSGSISNTEENKIHCGLINESIDLEQTVKRFWEIENVETEISESKEKIICEEHFKNNFSRNCEGRFIVKMPLKEDPKCLGKSKEFALKKLNSLWQGLIKDTNYLSLYTEFLREYLEMGHMSEVQGEEQEATYYIPHLGVYRPDKQSTVLRVVFNASYPTSKGNSLNSLQYNGGMVQGDLFSIMVRFRKYVYAFTADIKKMYRMILIHPSQRKLQRILWKENEKDQVKTYELNTVTYGTVSAPFLATRTLKQIAIEGGTNYPLAVPVIENDFYVDDVLTGSDNLVTAKELQKQLIEILENSGMQLHKWHSNCEELVSSGEEIYNFANCEETQVLGVSWSTKSDSLYFKVDFKTSQRKDCRVTKRCVLSTIARLFDPLGLLGPIVTKAKIFLQQLWSLKLDWHEILPEKQTQEWTKFVKSLYAVSTIKFDRCILTEGADVIEIHGFADASEAAYGAVIYCKCTKKGQSAIKLITSKSRVSPLKKITIPRLELCASVLLAKLVRKVIHALKLPITHTYLWSDSMIVLSWLRKEPFLLKTFVANRVTQVQDLTCIDTWRYVPSSENPADLISRGLDPEKLCQSKLWFEGPTFLCSSEYPNRDIPSRVIEDEFSIEFKQTSDSNCLISDTNDFLDNFLKISNNYSKIIRILSYVFRFIQNCQRKHEKSTGSISSDDLKQAEVRLVSLVQKREFAKDIKDLRSGEVSRQSQVKSLCPFVDKTGLLRVGGRLTNSNLNFDKKFPILLPGNHRLTRLIIASYHLKYLHVGPQTLLFTIRQKFWPINGRANCRKIVHECVTCFKAKPITCDQLMGDLPKERVSQNFPFVISGVDFCGPFTIKYKHQRKGTYQKIYLAIFVCFVTKAVHLELVTELSSQAFIATLKRFFSRRGNCRVLYSDNGTNFVGSNTELKRLFHVVKNPDENLSGYMSNENVEWRFLPPRAPNFGGLWEAGVRSFKYHLKRVVGGQKLTYEDFLTVINQIESILNSRPLTPLTSDVDDLSALTPGHFLIGRPFTSIVEPDVTNVSENRISLWQKTTKFVQLIWKKWYHDYLTTLHQRSKWCFDKQNIKVGDMVVIKEDNMAVCNWPIGRIVSVFPGKDGRIRVASIKTIRGVFKRPISKICILPIES